MGLLPELGGTCLVGPGSALEELRRGDDVLDRPYEAEAPAWFYVNPPDPSWDEDVKDRWRSLFSATTLPAITAHEVTPGHFAHGRMIRLTARGDVRRSLTSQLLSRAGPITPRSCWWRRAFERTTRALPSESGSRLWSG